MSLNKKDLQQIKEIVRDTVDFAISKSELKTSDHFDKMDERFDKIDVKFNKIDQKFVKLEQGLKDYIDKQTDDLAEINRELISRIDNHETRITRLEQKPIKA